MKLETSYLVLIRRNGDEGGAEAYSEVVGVHHVLITELGEVVEEGEEVAHHQEHGPRERHHHVADLARNVIHFIFILTIFSGKKFLTIS